jgi:hypothetical protein
MDAPLMPEHMDRWSRNQRLYETLKGMGLYVIPIPDSDDPSKIRELRVSAELPLAESVAEHTAQARVVPAVKRPVVGVGVDAAESGRDNVIDFPTVL